MMSSGPILLPGDAISPELLATLSSNAPLKLGPNLHHIPPSTVITSLAAGPLTTDVRKNVLYIPTSRGRYIPSIGDLVIATVHHGSADYTFCRLSPHTTNALLGNLAFEGATKKTRPQLQPGDLVYARVLKAEKHAETELVCFNPSTGKGEGMGELKGGMIFEVSLRMARRLLMKGKEGGIVCLEMLAERMAFEVAVGRNGKVWVRAEEGGVKGTLLVGKVLQETDEGALTVEEQKKLVRRLLGS